MLSIKLPSSRFYVLPEYQNFLYSNIRADLNGIADIEIMFIKIVQPFIYVIVIPGRVLKMFKLKSTVQIIIQNSVIDATAK